MINVEILKEDITTLEVDVIVNPANNYLIHGGGLAAEIVKRGGQIIQQESKKVGFVPTGSAVITTGGNLKAKHVIHAVGPKYKDGKSGEDEKLTKAVMSSLDIADKKKLTSIAIPAVSSGIFGYPVEESSDVILNTIKEFITNNKETSLEKIIVCLYDEESFDIFNKKFNSIFKDQEKPSKTKTKTVKKKKSDKTEEVKKTHKTKVHQDFPRTTK